MSNYYKNGGGNKPQPYIPPGNGDKSGEYAQKPKAKPVHVSNCFIKNTRLGFNFLKSKLVGKVTRVFVSGQGCSIPKHGVPNSVSKKVKMGFVVTERYYNNKGEPYLDIDYTDHHNPKTHPIVPHIHRWVRKENGEIDRENGEEFQ